jgi:hypothetical protein
MPPSYRARKLLHLDMKRAKSKGAGSQTNASDAMDRVELPSHPTLNEKVDEGVQETFPASDPVSVAHRATKTVQPPAPPRRSADWMFDKHQEN